MLVTEAEAIEKRCCAPRVSQMCMASQCMAWRWAKGTEDQQGYCSLAGEPVSTAVVVTPQPVSKRARNG